MKPHLALWALAALTLTHFTALHALANAAETGSISGVVKDANGKPIAGLAIRLEQHVPRGIGAGGKGGPRGKEPGTKTVAKTVTDAQGRFEFKNLPPGTYEVVAGSPSVGWIYQEVEVKANQETKLDDLQLVKVK